MTRYMLDHTSVVDLDTAEHIPIDTSDARFVACLAWVSAGGEPMLPPPTVLPIDLAAYAADARWRRETGGVVVDGTAIGTDRESQAMLAGAHAYVVATPGATITWKSENGFVMLDAAAVTALAAAVGAHVQACFAAEAAVVAAIAAGTITTPAEIDAAFAAI